MASEQILSSTTSTTTGEGKTNYEQQLEELWNAGTEQKNENDQTQGRGQMKKQPEGGDNNAKLEGLPLESSPYVKYSDLEDYKRKAYGTEGHLDPKPIRQIGADAPTLDGTTVTDYKELGCGK